MAHASNQFEVSMVAIQASLNLLLVRMKMIEERSKSTDATLARIARLQSSWAPREQVATTTMPLSATPTVASLNLSPGRETTSTMGARKVFDARSTQKEGSSWAKAFVQLRSGHEAVRARDALHGRNIYDGCCNISIECTPMVASATAAATSLAMGPNATSTTSNTEAALTSLGMPAVALEKLPTGAASTCAKVCTDMPSSPMTRPDAEVLQPGAVPTSVSIQLQSMPTSLVTEITAATPIIVDEIMASPLCHEKVQQHCSLKVFDSEVIGDEKKPRMIKWVSGVSISRRPVWWTARRKYHHSLPPPPPCPPDQQYSSTLLWDHNLFSPEKHAVESGYCIFEKVPRWRNNACGRRNTKKKRAVHVFQSGGRITSAELCEQ